MKRRHPPATSDAAPGEPGGGLPATVRGTVVTVGTFDGVHRGHQAILREIERRGRERSLHSVLLTFDRHPLTVLRPDRAPPALTTPNEKKEILAQFALDYVAFLPFTRALSRYEPEEYVREVLLRRLRARELVIGHDHGFGRSRAGDFRTLQRLGTRFGFDVDVVEEVEVDGAIVSSTAIRQLLLEGEAERAGRALGRPYAVWGTVVQGLGRGRSLGFPTANLVPPEGGKLIPRDGIYAVRASLRTEICRGLLHLGPRPTFPGSPPSMELYLFDFDRHIYGETVRVEFLSRLRDVRPFATAEALVEQMRRDRQVAARFFEADPGAGPEPPPGLYRLRKGM